MHFIQVVLAAAAFANTALGSPAATNTHQAHALAQRAAISAGHPTYHLKTSLKDGQANKSHFVGLTLSTYHTGAGLNDAVFYPSKPKQGAKAFLTDMSTTNSWGGKFAVQAFDLGNDFPWYTVMTNVDSDAHWQPVWINAASKPMGGFFMNSSGLQWTSSIEAPGSAADAFGGWIVCTGSHELPQLYYRTTTGSAGGSRAPKGCADVTLVPEYK